METRELCTEGNLKIQAIVSITSADDVEGQVAQQITKELAQSREEVVESAYRKHRELDQVECHGCSSQGTQAEIGANLNVTVMAKFQASTRPENVGGMTFQTMYKGEVVYGRLIEDRLIAVSRSASLAGFSLEDPPFT